MGSGLEISVSFQRLNDLAHRRVMDPQMIGNRLQRITMLDMRAINLLIPLRFVSCFYKPRFRNSVDFYCVAIEIGLKIHNEISGIDSLYLI
jgi:hypothetical protein